MPASLRQWLYLLGPAFINLLGGIIAFAMNSGRGQETKSYAVMGSGLVTMWIAALGCLALGYWMVRDSTHWGWKVSGTLLFGSLLAVVNGAIGFAGCMLFAG